MNIIGWLIWVVALFVGVGMIPLLRHSDPGVGRLTRGFLFLLGLGLLVTALTDVSKFHLLWWGPTAYVLNMVGFGTIFNYRMGRAFDRLFADKKESRLKELRDELASVQDERAAIDEEIARQEALAHARSKRAEAKLELEKYIYSLKPDSKPEEFVPPFSTWWGLAENQDLDLVDASEQYVKIFNLHDKVYPDEPEEVTLFRSVLNVLESSDISFKDDNDQFNFVMYQDSLRELVDDYQDSKERSKQLEKKIKEKALASHNFVDGVCTECKRSEDYVIQTDTFCSDEPEEQQ